MEKELAKYWDYPLGINFNDPDQAVKTIISYAEKTPVGAIIPVDDSGGDIAARASKELGLTYNSPAAAEAARDKYVMRSLLKDARINSPHFALHQFLGNLSDEELLSDIAAIAESVSYPCVLKPLTLSGSRGVIRANSAAEFVEAAVQLWKILQNIDQSTTPKSFLVEDYIPGIEVAVEAILDKGTLKVLALFDKPDPMEGPYFEETIYVTPSRLPGYVQDEIIECVIDASRILGLREGPVHAELRINDQGPWLIEVAGRSIGGLCSQSLRFGTDISLEELILRHAFGMDIHSAGREDQSSGVLMIPIPERGILKGVSGCDFAEAIPLVEKVEITARLNYVLTPLPEGDSYLGFIFARGERPKDVESALRLAHEKLAFDIVPDLVIASGHSHFQYQT
jgi:biotin carboxylase